MEAFDNPQAVPPLNQLSLYLSHGCSLACRGCGFSGHTGRLPVRTGSGKTRPLGEAYASTKPVEEPLHFDNLPLEGHPLEIMLAAVSEALPLGLRTVRLVGGEPLLHPDFNTLIDRLEQWELGVEIETSGAGLTPALADRLAELPQCSISIGLDGANAATHDAAHSAPGSFDTAVAAARNLAAAGKGAQIVFSVTRKNVAQIQEMISLAEHIGAAALRISVPRSGLGERAGAGSHAMLTVEELIALGRRIERVWTYQTHLRLTFDQPPAFRGLYPSAHIEGQGRCSVMTNLAVLPGGEYSICGAAFGPHTAPELIFGRVGVNSLASVWREHPVLVALRSGMPSRLEGVCGHCIMKTACLGNCVIENYLRGGSLWSPHWFCETADRIGLFPLGRIIENRW